MLFKRIPLIIVLFFSTIMFGMDTYSLEEFNTDFLNNYKCKDHELSPLLCHDRSDVLRCHGLKMFEYKNKDEAGLRRVKSLFWNEHEQYNDNLGHNYGKYKCIKHGTNVLKCPLPVDCNFELGFPVSGNFCRGLHYFIPKSNDDPKQTIFKAVFWLRHFPNYGTVRLNYGTEKEILNRKRTIKEKELTKQSKRLGVNMGLSTSKRLLATAAAGALIAGGITNGMDMTVSTLNDMLAAEPFRISNLTDKDGELKKVLRVNLIDTPRFLPFTQVFAKHMKNMHDEYGLPTCIAFVKDLESYVIDPKSVSVFNAFSIIKHWTRRPSRSSRKVLCGSTEFENPRTGGRVNINDVCFYRVELGEIIKNKNQSTTSKVDKKSPKEDKGCSNFAIDPDRLYSASVGEKEVENVKLNRLITMHLMGTLTDLIEFTKVSKAESNDTTAWGNGQAISLFSKSTARLRPSLKALLTLGNVFKTKRPESAIGFFKRLQDQNCDTKEKSSKYLLATWEFMTDFYKDNSGENNIYLSRAINICKIVEKDRNASTFEKTKAEEKRSTLQLEYDKSKKDNNPANNVGNALIQMMQKVVVDAKELTDQQNN